MKYRVIGLFLITGLLVSCDADRLDRYPETNLTSGNFYTSEQDLVLASNDIYRQLTRFFDAGGVPDLYGELFSDNVYIEFTTGAHSFAEDINTHRINSNNGFLETAWNTAYNAVYIANNVIEKLDNTTVQFSNPVLKERLRAEALTARAIIYYYLAQAWGPVPFPLKVVSPAESYSYLREDVSVIYSKLAEDLNAAKAVLPTSYTGNDAGRITRHAAGAVLARVHLAAGNRSAALSELESIIQSGQYSLDANGDGKIDAGDYAYLFSATAKNSKESILEVQYLAGQNNVNSQHQTTYAPWNFAFHLPGSNVTFRGNGLNTPSPDLVGEYEPADPRKNLSLLPGFTDLQTGIFTAYPYTVKFYDPNHLYPGQNVEIIRYADILLLYSELTGDPSYLNQVRARAGLPGFGESGYPSGLYPTVELAVEHERRVELAFEFHRFFDLVRTRRAVKVLTGKGIPVSAGQLLFPIPLSAIDANPALAQTP